MIINLVIHLIKHIAYVPNVTQCIENIKRNGLQTFINLESEMLG